MIDILCLYFFFALYLVTYTIHYRNYFIKFSKHLWDSISTVITDIIDLVALRFEKKYIEKEEINLKTL